jgi:hypothetical protein
MSKNLVHQLEEVVAIPTVVHWAMWERLSLGDAQQQFVVFSVFDRIGIRRVWVSGWPLGA